MFQIVIIIISPDQGAVYSGRNTNLYFCSGPAGRGGAPPGHVPQSGQHRQEAGQRAGQPGGRHSPPEEAGGDEHEVELPQSKEHGHQVWTV